MNGDLVIDLPPATDLSLAALAQLFTRSFEGYLLPVHVTAEALAQRVRGEHVDLFASRVLVHEGAPAGIALIARRGRQSRVAAMGIAAAARGRGLGRRLLDRVIEDARARGDRTLDLEVFESNTPAVALYRQAGFRSLRKLVSYEGEALEPAPLPLEEVDPDAFGRELQRAGEMDLPWQLSPDTLAFACAPTRVLTMGGVAFASVAQVTESVVTLRGIFTPPEHRRKGHATRLLRALKGAYPGRALAFPALLPEEAAAGFFTAAGFRRGPLTQLEMRIAP